MADCSLVIEPVLLNKSIAPVCLNEYSVTSLYIIFDLFSTDYDKSVPCPIPKGWDNGT
jgi:hypothetical protein